jgi:amino acid adenylation domain-containing protein
MDTIASGTGLYSVPGAVRLSGALDRGALEGALGEIVRRHETLRTTFPVRAGEPVQVVSATGPVSVEFHDLLGEPEGDGEGLARAIAEREAARPFDLAAGPVIRFVLVRLAGDCHVFAWNMHHIVSDGWSLGVFARELSELYAAFLEGRRPVLPELPVQYADYAAWQRVWLRGGVLDEQLAFWRQQLAGAPVLLDLPTDRPRPAVRSFRGDSETFTISAPLRAGLEALCRQAGVTLFMALQAAFAVLLARHSGQEDVVVAAPNANRAHASVEPLIGFFANVLVLRTRLGDNPTFWDLLHRVRRSVLDAYAHQDVPFEKLVEELRPPRNLSHNPLVQVSLAYQNVSQQPLTLPGLGVERFELVRQAVRYDLEIHVSESGEELACRAIYITDLFDAETVTRLTGQLQVLLANAVADPRARVGGIGLLSEAERNRLVTEWNHTRVGYPHDLCLHQLFEEQVSRTPDNTAVECGDGSLSYRDLNERANQLARYLRDQGIGPEVLVGLCVERSLEMVIALLGILKAGGAYVPLDPSYPEERLAFMLADSKAPLVITQDRIRRNLDFPAAVFCIDSDWSAVAHREARNLVCVTDPRNPVYAIYTSGSTGRPKGIVLPHQALVNLIAWHIGAMNHPRAVLQYASLSFDASSLEIFTALASGQKIVVINEIERFRVERIVDAIIKKEIGKVILPVVILQELAAYKEVSPEDMAGLQDVIATGERLTLTRQVREFFERVPGCRLHNHYGPTETHVATSYVFTGSPGSWRGDAPIGRPIYNTRIYILDVFGEPVPVGVAGELFIGGPGLARGYLGRPGLTAERFVPDPFSGIPGARLYRTGDLARYRRDGTIDFLGRNDRQVKLRGYRIELGEVEAVLGRHPAAGEVVVYAEEMPSGDRRLVGYVSPRPGEAPSVEDLRRFLGRELPDYMIPAAFVLVERLPLTPNGKIDYRVLPAPDGSRGERETAEVGPRTLTEAILCEIWAGLLQLDRVGVHDVFFDLGGHSLLVMRMLLRIREALDVDLPLRRVFEGPTVAGIAAAVDMARAGGSQLSGLNRSVRRLPPCQ